MNEVEVCKIVKTETIHGTFYIPYRLVTKRPWFKEAYETFEPFFVGTDQYGIYGFHSFDMCDKTVVDSLKDIRLAEKYCSEYMRCYYGNKTVKSYTIEE